jgi:hypothetical protein
MGLFKSIKKAFKKVTNGIKKAVKGVVKGVKKVVKKISSSKILKALAIAAAVVVTGGAAVAAFTGGTAASGTFAGWMMNASQAVTGGTLFGTSTALARGAGTAAKFIATPFKAVGTALGSAAATVTDFTGLTTEASRTGINVSQQAAIAGQPVTTPMPSLSEDQILQGLNPAEVAKAQQDAFFMPSTSVESQLASSTQAAFESGSAIGTSTGVVSPTLTTTAGSFNVPTALPSASYATGTPAQQLAQTVPSALGIPPVEASVSVAEKLSLTEKYPKTTAFIASAAGSMAGKVFDAYTDSLLAGDPRGREGGTLGDEGGARKDPIGVYTNELNINPDDYSKYFTFSNTIEAGNMPLFQQQTIEVT